MSVLTWEDPASNGPNKFRWICSPMRLVLVMLFRPLILLWLPCLSLLHAISIGAAPLATAAAKGVATGAAISYRQQVVPVLEKYCYSCHGRGKSKGDFSLDPYQSET